MKQRIGIVLTTLGASIVAACSPSVPKAAPPKAAASATPVKASGGVPKPQSAVLARDEVALEEDGGTFVVPVLINDTITLKFTLDSGAADVSIPADVVSTLFRAGTINSTDFIGSKTFALADGSTVPSTEFRIRSLKVGNLVLHDVVGSTANANGSLLLGQSFLSLLTSWSIDNQRHVLVLNGQAQAQERPPPQVSAVADSAQSGTGNLALSTPDTTATQEAGAATAVALQVIATWSAPDDEDGAAVRRFYADHVNYYGAPIDADRVMQDKTRFAARWPVRAYTARPQSLKADCAGGLCTVTGIIDWYAANASTGAISKGAAQFSYGIAGGLVVSESSKVVGRQ